MLGAIYLGQTWLGASGGIIDIEAPLEDIFATVVLFVDGQKASALVSRTATKARMSATLTTVVVQKTEVEL